MIELSITEFPCLYEGHDHNCLLADGAFLMCPNFYEYLLRGDGGGFVYILRAESGDFCKIGKTKELDKRIQRLSIQLPFKTTVAAAYRVGHMNEMESTLHEQLSDHRLNGEWFKLSAEQLSKIDDYMKGTIGVEKITLPTK